MKRAYIPRDALAASIQSGRIAARQSGLGIWLVVSVLAQSRLEKTKAHVSPSSEIRCPPIFPPICCNCLAEDAGVQAIELESTVNCGVAYIFRFAVPHCEACRSTANRKRVSVARLLAVFFLSSVLVTLAVAVVGGVMDCESLVSASFFIGPLSGVASAILTAKPRRLHPGQTSTHQAVYASSLLREFSGTLKGAVLSFTNDAYADRFIAANADIGVVAR